MKELIYIKTNGNVLRWARESLVITRAKAAKDLKITVNRLGEVEGGTKFPTIDELRSMSKVYKRTIATLLLREKPKEKPLPKDRRTIDSTDLGSFDQKTIIAVRKVRALANSLLELRKEAGLNQLQFNHKALISDDPSIIARDLRKELQISAVRELDNINYALEAYIEHLEAIGIAVFQVSLTQDKLRGFSLLDEQIPVIAIKRGNEAPTSKIFTLFHELGHVLLNEGGLCDIVFSTAAHQIEKWCNAFAAEVLVPAEELLQNELVQKQMVSGNKIWLKKDLVEISIKFHVGPLTILRCLLEQNLTTNDYYNEKHREWSKPHFARSKSKEGRNIPKETLKEKGRNYVKLAFNVYDQNKIDLKDLSDFLGVKLVHLAKTRQLVSM